MGILNLNLKNIYVVLHEDSPIHTFNDIIKHFFPLKDQKKRREKLEAEAGAQKSQMKLSGAN